jgi:hypothetical protein
MPENDFLPAATQAHSESRIQSDCVTWFKNHYRSQRLLCFMVHNDGAKSARTGLLDKARGLTKGIPDVMLAIPTPNWAGLFVEFKTPGEYPTPAQREAMAALTQAGYRCEVIRSLPEFQTLIREYLQENIN